MWLSITWFGFLAMLDSLFEKVSSEKIYGSVNGKPLQLFPNIALQNVSLIKDSVCIAYWKLDKATIADEFISRNYVGKIVMDNDTNILIDNLDDKYGGIYIIVNDKWKKFTETGKGKQILFPKVALEEVSLYKNTSLIAIWNLATQELMWINPSYARRLFMDSKSSILMSDIDKLDAGRYVIKYSLLDNSTGPEVELIVLEECSLEEQVVKFLENHPEIAWKLLEQQDKKSWEEHHGLQIILLVVILVVVLLPKFAWSMFRYIGFLCVNKMIGLKLKHKRKDEGQFKTVTPSGNSSIVTKSRDTEDAQEYEGLM